jgi:hypothetical protein
LLQNGISLLQGTGQQFHCCFSERQPGGERNLTAGSLNTARAGHCDVVNGMVLVAGGQDSNFIVSATPNWDDPASGIWNHR